MNTADLVYRPGKEFFVSILDPEDNDNLIPASIAAMKDEEAQKYLARELGMTKEHVFFRICMKNELCFDPQYELYRSLHTQCYYCRNSMRYEIEMKEYPHLNLRIFSLDWYYVAYRAPTDEFMTIVEASTCSDDIDVHELITFFDIYSEPKYPGTRICETCRLELFEVRSRSYYQQLKTKLEIIHAHYRKHYDTWIFDRFNRGALIPGLIANIDDENIPSLCSTVNVKKEREYVATLFAKTMEFYNPRMKRAGGPGFIIKELENEARTMELGMDHSCELPPDSCVNISNLLQEDLQWLSESEGE